MSCLYQSLVELYRRTDYKLRKDVVGLALVNSLVIVLGILAYMWWRHPLYGQNKGRRVYPLTGTLIDLLRNKDRLLEYDTETLAKIPGHTIRSVYPGGATIYMTANPANVEHILKTNFENYPKGDFFHENLRQLLGDGIFNVDDDLWRIQRKVTSSVFTTRLLRVFLSEFVANESSSRLVPVLSNAAESGRLLDLQDIFSRFSFDNICQLAFGVDPACLAPSLPHVEFVLAFDKATLLSLKRLQAFPRSIWILQEMLNIGQPKELGEAVRVIDDFAMGVIKKRRQELALAAASGEKLIGSKADLLSRFMTLVENEQSEEGTGRLDSERKSMENYHGQNLTSRNTFSDVFLRDIIISFILAGRDSSTGALSFFFWLLSSHPAVESEILEEIRSVLRDRTSEGNAAEKYSSFTFEELKKMHYLQAALSESMRLYPPVPVDIKFVRKDDVLPDGTVVTANAAMGYHPYAMGRMEDLWGKDCLEFKPERWLRDGVFVPQSPYKYSVFQAGPRVCLGKDMVMFQMKLMCTEIIANFEISIPADFRMEYFLTLNLKLKNGLPVTVKRRASANEIQIQDRSVPLT